MRFSKRFITIILPGLLLPMQGCGPDCQGVRGSIKSGLGGQCLASSSTSGPQPASVTVNGAAPFIAAGGGTVQFTATTTFDDSSNDDSTGDVTWSLSNPTVGTIDANGLFTSSATGGITDVIATHETASSTATLKVVGTVTDVTVGTTPSKVYLRPNSTEAWVVNIAPTNQITVLDTTTNSVITSINFGAGNASNNLVFLSDGSKAYFTTGGPPNRIWSINGSTKAFSVVTTTSSYGVQPAVSPDDAYVYYAQNMAPADVFRINTTTEAVTTFDTTPACPTGVDISAAGKMFVSDQCHGGSDWMYVYNDYTNTASTNFSIAGFIATSVKISPDGSRVMAHSGPPNNDRMLNGTTNAVMDSIASYGYWSFFGDNTRVIFGKHNSTYTIYDHTGATLNSLEVLAGITAPADGGLVAISSQSTLYIPVGGTNTIRVYQHR